MQLEAEQAETTKMHAVKQECLPKRSCSYSQLATEGHSEKFVKLNKCLNLN